MKSFKIKNTINSKNFLELDKKAKELARNYLRLEAELLSVIIEIEQTKSFYKLGFSSLFAYVNQSLKISPAITCNFIRVARKSCEVPELKKQVMKGLISISKAQKMTSVLTPDNKEHWLSLAQKSTHRELERAVALSSPSQQTFERTRLRHNDQYVEEKVRVKTSMPRVELQVGISERLMMKIRRAQDIESGRQKKNLNIEQTLENIIEIYLDKKDPMRKAKRQKMKGKLNNSSREELLEETEVAPKENKIKFKKNEKLNQSNLYNKKERDLFVANEINKSGVLVKSQNILSRRLVVPAKTRHEIFLRDGGKCSFRSTKGTRCASRRFLEVHHIRPISHGGDNQLENLTLLCSGHHKVMHSM